MTPPKDPPPVSARRPNLPTPREGAPADAGDAVDQLRERFRLEMSDDGTVMHFTCREDGCADGRWVFPMGDKPKDRAEANARIAPVARELGKHADAHDAKAQAASAKAPS
jgi:hypothetical protein